MAQRGPKPKEKIIPEIKTNEPAEIIQAELPAPVEPVIKILQAKPMTPRAQPQLSHAAPVNQSDNVWLVNSSTGKKTWMSRGSALRQVRKYPATYKIQ